jgi:hypothetical protein
MRVRPFISYAHEDLADAIRLHRELTEMGASPWMDRFDLIGGENLSFAITRALRDCSHVVVLVSSQSVTKTGFVQKELQRALELLQEHPPERIFMIPVRLDQSEPSHPILRELVWIDLFTDYAAGLSQLARSLGLELQRATQTSAASTIGLDSARPLSPELNVASHFGSGHKKWPDMPSICPICYHNLPPGGAVVRCNNCHQLIFE